MKTAKALSLLTFCGTLGLLTGCVSESESHLVTTPPPPAPVTDPAVQQVVVVSAEQQVAADAVGAPAHSYIVIQKPPEPQAPEGSPERPGSEYVWVSGYWTWQNNRYTWMTGHWIVPPYSGAKWVKPHTEPEADAFRFYEGHWN